MPRCQDNGFPHPLLPPPLQALRPRACSHLYTLLPLACSAWKKLHEVHARLLEEQRARSERLRALRGAGPDEAPAKPRDWSHSSREREASNGARRRDRSWERGGRDERDRRYRDRSREARPLRHGDGRGPRDETGRRRREEGARDAGGRSRSRDRRPARDYDEGRGQDRKPVGSAQHGAAEEGEI